MKIYAVLNENKICTGISQLSGEVVQENMIEIPSVSVDCLWKKYENNTWSTEKFEPVSTAPIDEFTELKQRQELMQKAIDDLVLGGAL